MHHALGALATAAPDWLRVHTTLAWVDRYGRRANEFRLPKSEAGRRAWARQTGVDGVTLLALATAGAAPPILRGVAALETMRQVWTQNFLVEHGPEGPRVDGRTNNQAPPSGRYIGSPYDPQARYATKGATVWSGYKVHLSETCDDGVANLITNVETTTVAVSDDALTSTIHAALDARGLLPKTHVADTGFVNSALFVGAQDRFGIDLVPDPRRPAVAGSGRCRVRRARLRHRLHPAATSPSSGRRVRPEK